MIPAAVTEAHPMNTKLKVPRASAVNRRVSDAMAPGRKGEGRLRDGEL